MKTLKLLTFVMNLIRIRKEGKKDILTNKCSIGKPYDEATGIGKVADDSRTH